MSSMEAGTVSVTAPLLAQQMNDGTLSTQRTKTARAKSLKYEKNKDMPGILLTEELTLLKQQRVWVAKIFILWFSTKGSELQNQVCKVLEVQCNLGILSLTDFPFAFMIWGDHKEKSQTAWCFLAYSWWL